MKSANYEATRVIFSILLLPLSLVQLFSSVLYSQIPSVYTSLRIDPYEKTGEVEVLDNLMCTFL
jgi:hypothetical protein